MTLARQLTTESQTGAPQTTWYVWINYLLPKMDEKSLLVFAQTSKQSRQLAFAELFSRPGFKNKIDDRISCFQFESTYFSRAYHIRDEAFWGRDQTCTNALRLTQFTSLVGALCIALIMCETYRQGYPSDSQVQAAMARWIASPTYRTPFDVGCNELWLTAFPNDGYRSLTMTIVGLISLSLLLGKCFNYANADVINELKRSEAISEDYKAKVKGLKYLPDVLPREVLTSRSLFANPSDYCKKKNVNPQGLMRLYKAFANV